LSAFKYGYRLLRFIAAAGLRVRCGTGSCDGLVSYEETHDDHHGHLHNAHVSAYSNDAVQRRRDGGQTTFSPRKSDEPRPPLFASLMN
jgi:hypothetical protein